MCIRDRVKAAAGGTKAGFPVIGTGYAVIEGLVRLALGDPKGMLLSFGSGIPAAGWGFAIIDILRDIDRDAYTKHIEPNLPIPSDANIAAFFSTALGIGPEEYERGNISAPIRGMGTDLSSITDILSVTKAFGAATGFSGPIDSLISSSGLSGYSAPKSNYTFDVGASVSSVSIGRSAMEKEDQLSIERRQKTIEEIEADIATKNQSNEEEVETRRKDGKKEGKNQWWDFMDVFANPDDKGEGGPGSVISQNGMLAHHTATYAGVKIDASGEPGVDFTPEGDDNRAIFDGYVSDIGHQYSPNSIGGDGRQGAGYGHYIGITSVDPKTGDKFESLYAHFPEGELDKWKVGDKVNYGDILGRMATSAEYADPKTRYHVGSGTGPHSSVDFLVPGTVKPYPNWKNLVPLIDIKFESKSTTNQSSLNNQSSLINVESNNRLAATMTNMVENGSSERLMTKRKASKRPPIVIINNQIVNTSQTQIAMGNNNKESGNFFEAYNLARHTV